MRRSALVSLLSPALSLAAAVYDPTTLTVHIPSLRIGDTSDRYQADLHRVTGGWPWLFEVTQLRLANTALPIDGHYHPQDATLVLPEVQTPGGGRYATHLHLLPGGTPYRLILTDLRDQNGQRIGPRLDSGDGALRLSPERFERLATQATLTGASIPNNQEVKFIILGVDTPRPVLLFQNSQRYPYHFDFVYDALKLYQLSGERQTDQARFLAETYFTANRRNLGGSLVRYPDAEGGARYVLEFWPSDPVPLEGIALAHRLLIQAAPFIETLPWHPNSETQRQLYETAKDDFGRANIPVISSRQLLGNVREAVYNPGEAYGRLRLVQPGDRSPGFGDIAIFPTLPPNDLGQVAGIITEAPQTLLSHLNLRAVQDGRPNAYLADAAQQAQAQGLLDQWVHYRADADGVHLEPATEAEARQWLDSQRPDIVQIPAADLSVTEPMPLRQIGFDDRSAFGVKAANVAELGKILPPSQVPDGYAIPFALYDRFMDLPRCGDERTALCGDGEAGLSFYDQARQMLADPDFLADPEYRRAQLKAFRKRIKKGEAPADMIAQLEAIRRFWNPEGPPFTQSLRLRSSTNNEDLPFFNGAGLYRSTTHKPDEGDLIESAKKVWASLWNEQAFEAREFYGIDHFQIYMGILVHPNYGDEQANGVAVSRNLYIPQWPGYTVSAQYGEISVTNPEPIERDDGTFVPIPDEFVLARLPISQTAEDRETIYLHHSNVTEVYGEPVPTPTVLTPEEIDELRQALAVIHHHFKRRYGGGKDFAIEIEFKITQTDDGSRGHLSIKQARPWVH